MREDQCKHQHQHQHHHHHQPQPVTKTNSMINTMTPNYHSTDWLGKFITALPKADAMKKGVSEAKANEMNVESASKAKVNSTSPFHIKRHLQHTSKHHKLKSSSPGTTSTFSFESHLKFTLSTCRPN